MLHFTSDNHFQHENIVTRFNRGNGKFSSISHHDSVLVQNWWETVGADDTVYVLGDAALGDLMKSLAIFATLPGNKKLVPGNHDRVFSATNSVRRRTESVKLYEDAGFEILPENTEISIATPSGDKTVLLSHFPFEETDLPHDKWLKNRPDKTRKLPLLHGHTHSVNRFSSNPLEFNVGVDANNFTPVPETVIVDWLETLEAPPVKRRK